MKFSAEGPQEEARIWRSDYDAAHFPIAGSDPTSLCSVCFGLVVVVWFLFAVFFCFWLRFFWFLAGTARWTAYRSTTSTFVAIDK